MTTVREIVTRIALGWDDIYVRVYQDGGWQTLTLSDVEDQELVKQTIVEWIEGASG